MLEKVLGNESGYSSEIFIKVKNFKKIQFDKIEVELHWKVYFCSTSLSSGNQVDGSLLAVHLPNRGVSDNRYFSNKVKKNIKFKPYIPDYILIIYSI